ncbi:MAG: hypothetical protein RLZZ238_2409 [Planctomycetota bacterium]
MAARSRWSVVSVILGASVLLAAATAAERSAAPPTLARPDAREPDRTKKVKVFILMGQSNMVGMGDIGPETKQGTLEQLVASDARFAYLREEPGDDEGGARWSVRRDVYYYDAREKHGAPLSALANNGKSIGPELGFGFVLGQVVDEPVLLIKSCIGNRSLGWDLLPPGSERFEVDGRTYAGYRDTPDSWVEGQPKKEVDWYAGKQYDTDLANAKAALARISEFWPGFGEAGYEIAGFVWWQGHKDQNAVHAARYERNLAKLIECLRRDYDAPQAKFVLATIGFGGAALSGHGLTVAEAQLAISDPAKHPELVGSVATVESRDLWRAADISPNGRQGHHYNRNAETYLEVGVRLGWAMARLLGIPVEAADTP